MDTEIVEVRNAGSKPVVLAYAGRRYPINPDERAAVPVQAAKRSVGDWERSDDPESNYLPRTRERSRLATLYGLCGDAFYSDDPIVTASLAIEADGGNMRVKPADYDPVAAVDGRRVYMHPNLPRLEVFDLVGNRIITVLDDPDGDMATGGAFHAVRRDAEAATKDQIASLQAQVTALVNQLAVSDPEAARTIAVAATPDPSTPTPAATAASAPAVDEMDVMAAELGHDTPDTPDTPKPAKKRAAKKAAARRGDDD